MTVGRDQYVGIAGALKELAIVSMSIKPCSVARRRCVKGEARGNTQPHGATDH
jgi:hypothetical protein